MKRLALLLVVFLFASSSVAASTGPELFMKAKEQVKAGSWQDALKTLDALEAEAARPGNEEMRQQLVAPIAFYRGVCEANLGDSEKARADFATFLKEKPGATIGKGMYSKKAVEAFEAVSKESAPAASSAAADNSPSLLQRYQEFKAPPNMGEQPDDKWADGPTKWIMTAEERGAWASLTGGAERAEFVEKFWEKRNPKPLSADNTARTSFDRRVAFADAYFRLDEKQRGSLTDRGMVFVLFGPPAWAGRKPILAGEDPSDSAGMFTEDQTLVSGATRNSVHIPGARATDTSADFREIWHYRREVLPKTVSYLQVDVVFITKKGYGRHVLQRDAAVLATLEAARRKPSG